MKELTTEQIQIAAANYRLARQHMTNAVEELRKFVIAMTNVNDGKVTGFNPFDERRGGLNLNNLDDRDLADYRERLEKGCWHLLLNNTGIMEAATRDDRCSLEEQINSGVFGAFTEASIIRALRKLKETEGSFVKNVVREAFRYFSPNYAKKEPIRLQLRRIRLHLFFELLHSGLGAVGKSPASLGPQTVAGLQRQSRLPDE